MPLTRLSFRGDLALLAVAAIWGSTFTVVKEALNDASPFLFLLLRFSLASLTLALVLGNRIVPPPSQAAASWRGGIAAGFWLFLAFATQTVGLQYTTPTRSAFITSLSIILVPLLQPFVLKLKPSKTEVAAVLIAFIGLSLLTRGDMTPEVQLGDLLTLVCAFGFAAHILVLGNYARVGSVSTIAFLQVVVSAVCSGLCFWWIEEPTLVWSWRLLVALLITGWLATAVAFSVQVWAQQVVSPARTGLLLSTEPLWAALIAYAWFGETLSIQGWAGAGLILAGVLLVELKRKS